MVAEAQQERSRETVSRILAAANLLWAEGGLKAVTHRAVAARAGVSLSATTRYFASKDALLAETYAWGVAQARARYRDMADRLFAEPSSDLASYCRSILAEDLTRYAAENAAWYNVLIESARDPALRPTTCVSFDEMDAFWRSLGERSGIADAGAVEALLDMLVGEYLLVFASQSPRDLAIRAAEERISRAADATAA